MLKELDTVVLAVDLPEYGLSQGDLGTVVLVHEDRSYEVEFMTLDGETLAVVSLFADQVLAIGRREIAHARAVSSEATMAPAPRTSARWRKILLALGAVGLAAAVCGILLAFVLEMWTQATLLPIVEDRIGARIHGPYVTLGNRDREVMVFSSVVPGGAAATAGVMNDDIVAERISFGDLCRRLTAPRGTSVTVVVVPGGNGPPIEQRPHRRVSITLP